MRAMYLMSYIIGLKLKRLGFHSRMLDVATDSILVVQYCMLELECVFQKHDSARVQSQGNFVVLND